MNTKVSVNPAVIIACLIGLTWLILVWLRFSVSVELTSPGGTSVPTTTPETRSSIVNATSSVATTELVEPTTTPSTLSQADLGLRQGALRVSNQTNQPVRLALLARRSAPSGKTYNSPAHWDFAPREGSGQGLVLSLPDSSLKLKSGDILVAFAQDGSRRYWGPFVVGETALPVWNNQTEEWHLILK